MKEKLQRFMYGRYGLDSFGKFTIIVSLVLMLLANFVPARLGSVLSLLCWALLIYTVSVCSQDKLINVPVRTRLIWQKQRKSDISSPHRKV